MEAGDRPQMSDMLKKKRGLILKLLPSLKGVEVHARTG